MTDQPTLLGFVVQPTIGTVVFRSHPTEEQRVAWRDLPDGQVEFAVRRDYAPRGEGYIGDRRFVVEKTRPSAMPPGLYVVLGRWLAEAAS